MGDSFFFFFRDLGTYRFTMVFGALSQHNCPLPKYQSDRCRRLLFTPAEVHIESLNLSPAHHAEVEFNPRRPELPQFCEISEIVQAAALRFL